MSAPLRVLSVPAGHRYVEHAIGRAGRVEDGLLVVPDPPVPGAQPHIWWPHPGLDPKWVRGHRDGFDVAHVHFGYEHRTPEQLARWVGELGRPLVITVHDLQLPLTVDQAAHEARTTVLLNAAAEIMTLTPGAAEQIRQRWGMQARVLPHPRMASSQTIRNSVQPAKQEVTVGLHLKGLRANHGGVPLLDAAAAAVAELPGARLLVNVHEEVRDSGAPEVIEALDRAQDAGAQVEWTPRLSDAQFHDYLRRIDVSLIPHRWGTHSGWLEECLDLGAVPVAPRIGHLAEQADVPGYDWNRDAPDTASLAGALTTAAATARRGRSEQEAARWAEHREQTDAATRRAHRALYRQVTA